jgi:hypothetical protein
MAWGVGIKIKDFEAKFTRVQPASMTIGLALIGLGSSILSPNIYEYIFGQIIGAKDLLYSPIYGIIAVVVGSFIGLFGAYLSRLRNERMEHDKNQYDYFQQIMDDAKFDEIVYDLRNHNAIYTSNNTVLSNFLLGVRNPRQIFLTKAIQESIYKLEGSLNALANIMTRNFFHLPHNVGSQARLHLRPSWNQDFSDDVTHKQMQQYNEQEDEKDKLLDKFEEDFHNYKLSIKKQLKITI